MGCEECKALGLSVLAWKTVFWCCYFLCRKGLVLNLRKECKKEGHVVFVCTISVDFWGYLVKSELSRKTLCHHSYMPFILKLYHFRELSSFLVFVVQVGLTPFPSYKALTHTWLVIPGHVTQHKPIRALPGLSVEPLGKMHYLFTKISFVRMV